MGWENTGNGIAGITRNIIFMGEKAFSEHSLLKTHLSSHCILSLKSSGPATTASSFCTTCFYVYSWTDTAASPGSLTGHTAPDALLQRGPR